MLKLRAKETIVGLLMAVFLFGAAVSEARIRVPFNPRTTPANIKLRGDFALTGNSNLTLVVCGDDIQNNNWSTGAKTQSIVVSTAGTCTVCVVDANGCPGDSYGTTVFINALPVPVIATDGPLDFCAGGSLTLSAQLVATGTYEVTVTNQFGCTETASIDVLVSNPSPEVVANGPTTFCDGDSVNLAVTASYDGYLWSTGETTPSIWVSTSGLYTVSVTNQFGCSSEASGVVVTVNPNPVPEVLATGGTDLCAGETVVLATTVFNSYVWSTGETSQFITVDSTGVFTVSVTNSFGCTGTSDTTSVTVFDPPVVDIQANGPTTICTGQSVELTAIGAGPFVWSTGETTSTITVFVPGDYFVGTFDAVTGCVNTSDTLTIGVYPLFIPEITADSPTAFCGSGTVTLTVVDGASFLWTTGETTQSITVDSTGIYGVVVTDANGCEGLAAETVTVLPSPLAIIVPDLDVPYCDGETITLTVTPELGGSYLWNTGETSESIQVTESGLYSVVVTNIFGCANEGFLPIGFVPTPTVTASVSGSGVICEGDVAQLTASFTLGGNYVWINGATGQTISVSESGTYSVTVTNLAGCSASSNGVLIEVVPGPQANAGLDVNICLGQSATLIATGGDAYVWSPDGSTNDTIVVSPLVSTMYVVSVEAGSCGQASSDTVWVIVTPQPTAAFQNSEGFQGDVISFTDLSTPQLGITSWEWSFGNGDVSGVQNPQFTFADTGTFSVNLVVTTSNGCADTVSKDLIIEEIFEIPNVLTPNNDGFNDYAWIVSSASDVINATIYNRWGVSVWSGIGKDLRWTGRTSAGAELPAGTYYYVIIVDYGDNVLKDYTGFITLIRD